MGFLLRASLGFAIAFALYAPQSFAAHLPLPALMRVKVDLVAAHPAARLGDMIAGRIIGSPGQSRTHVRLGSLPFKKSNE